MTPAEWSRIQQGIFAGESGGDYGALFGYQNRPNGRFSGVDLTKMTVDQALDFANPSGPYGQYVKGQVGRVATPMGAYQIVGTTLRAAKEGLGLRGDEVLTPAMQDRLGQWIYKTQGTGAWEGYKPMTDAQAIAAETMSLLGKGPQTSTKGPQMMQEQKPQGLLGSLGIQKMEEGAEGETGQRFYQRDSFKDTAAVLAQGFGRMGIMGMEEIADGIAKQRTEAKAKNKTMEALSKMNTPQAQAAVEYINAGGDAVSALKMAFAKPAAGEVREINGKLVRVMPDNTVVDLVDGGPNKEDVAKLRKEFTDAQEVKTFVPIARQYANIISAASSGTGPGDISLVFSYMKLLDPTSSVQQGEQATAANAAGAPSKVRSLYNQLVGGGNLDNTARDQFVAAATELYENAKAPYDEKVNYYKGLAGQYGYNPENVVPETGYRGPTYTPWAQRPPPAAVAALKGNPSEDMMRQFDAKYGQGAAARALGR